MKIQLKAPERNLELSRTITLHVTPGPAVKLGMHGPMPGSLSASNSVNNNMLLSKLTLLLQDAYVESCDGLYKVFADSFHLLLLLLLLLCLSIDQSYQSI